MVANGPTSLALSAQDRAKVKSAASVSSVPSSTPYCALPPCSHHHHYSFHHHLYTEDVEFTPSVWPELCAVQARRAVAHKTHAHIPSEGDLCVKPAGQQVLLNQTHPLCCEQTSLLQSYSRKKRRTRRRRQWRRAALHSGVPGRWQGPAKAAA
ncbi:hypothetical protein JOB18_040618, partial [Solea senegalensis]